MDDFDWLPGRSSELLSPRPLMKYCRTSDKWYCAEAINHKNITITYSCSMNQSITQSHVSSLLDYWKHKYIVKSHLLQQSTDTLRMITVIGLVFLDLHIPLNKTENREAFGLSESDELNSYLVLILAHVLNTQPNTDFLCLFHP